MAADGPAADQTAAPGVAVFALEDPRQADVAALVAELDREMLGVYDEDAVYMSSVDDLATDYVHFLVARYQGHAVGCGALVVKDLDWGELKRMLCGPWPAAKDWGRRSSKTCWIWRSGAIWLSWAGNRAEAGAAVALYREKGFVGATPSRLHRR